jgi:hypothetical protein
VTYQCCDRSECAVTRGAIVSSSASCWLPRLASRTAWSVSNPSGARCLHESGPARAERKCIFSTDETTWMPQTMVFALGHFRREQKLGE